MSTKELVPIKYCEGVDYTHQVHIWWFTCLGCDETHYVLCNGVPE